MFVRGELQPLLYKLMQRGGRVPLFWLKLEKSGHHKRLRSLLWTWMTQRSRSRDKWC